MRYFSVVVCQESGIEHSVRDCLQDWSGKGLLEPFVWGRVKAKGRGSDLVDYWLVQHGSCEEVSLLDELGGRRFDALRFVHAQILESSNEDAPLAITRAVGDLVTQLEDAVAVAQSVFTINALIPASGVRSISPERLEQTWRANLLVSNEDRVAPDQANRGVTGDKNLAGHASLALSVVAGLWTEIDELPYDAERIGQSGEGRLIVVRHHARVLRSGFVADTVSQSVFDQRPYDGRAASLAGATLSPNPAHLVSRVANEFASSHGMAYAPPPEKKPPSPGRINIWRVFPDMFAFVLSRGRLHAEALRQAVGRRGLERIVMRLTGGVAPETQPDDEQAKSDASAELQALAAEYLRKLEHSATPPATAATWEGLRELSFTLIDAGPTSPEIQAPMDGARPLVVGAPKWVAPSPDDEFVVEAGPAAGKRVRSCDPLQARSLLQSLHASVAETQPEDASEREEGPVSNGDAKADAAPVPEAVKLDAWMNGRRQSFLWQVAEHLARGLDSAASEMRRQGANALAGPAGTDPHSGQRAYEVLKKIWLLTGLVALWGLIVGLIQMITDHWDFLWLFTRDLRLSDVQVMAIALAWWLGGWVLSFIWYQRRMLGLHNQQSLALHQWQESVRAAQHAASEIVRLAASYDQLRDWAEIIGWMLYRPEGTLPEPSLENDEAEPRTKPSALQVAIGRSSSGQIQRLAATTARNIYGRGWVGNLFARYREAAMRGFSRRVGLSDDAAPDPDREIYSPELRQELLAALRDGTYAPTWHASVRATVQEDLASAGPEEIFDELAWPQESQPPPSLADVPPSEFLSAIETRTSNQAQDAFAGSVFSPAARIARMDLVDRIYVWSSARRIGSESSEAKVVRKTVPTGDSDFLATLRMDISANCRASDTAVLDDPSEEGLPDHRPASGRDEIG